MFGLSWGQIAIIVLVGVFLLGPERIPTAVSWVASSLRKLRALAVGAQAEMRKELGPELEEMRKQIAELQSLKELQELRELRELHPRRIIGRNLLGDQFTGGLAGFLDLDGRSGEKTGQPAAGTAGQGSTRLTKSPGAPAATSAAPAVPPTRTSPQPHPVPNAGGSANPSGPDRPRTADERPPFDADGT